MVSHITKSHKIKSKEYYDNYIKKENEGICLNCQKKTSFKNFSYGYHIYCSVKCSNNSSKVKNKRFDTLLERYGSSGPLANKNSQNKYKKTCLERYGVENPSNNKEIRKKQKKTCLERYGVENPLQNKKIKEKMNKTNLKKYGVENVSQLEEVKENKRSKLYKKFNILFNKYLSFLNIYLLDNNYIDSKFEHKWKCLKCGFIFKQKWNNIQQGYNCSICYPRYQGYSRSEKELSDFIKLSNIEIIENDRCTISPYELDIYIPSKNIAIEFNGLYYHTEKFKIDKNYHLNKTELCKSKNIQLIHIFEDEWIFKNEIVKSRLKHILDINNKIKIGARKCQIKEISPKLKNIFLNKFHIQGEDKSSIKLGTFYNDELISVMTFSKGNISKGSKSIKNIWELSRFCSNSNYHIPGIASKLLSYFKRNYQWEEIFSYADRRWSQGNLYKKIGFELDSITKPNYWYIKNGIRIHRFNLRKRPNEPKDIPEWILRQQEGYFRIWDCGHLKFKMEKY